MTPTGSQFLGTPEPPVAHHQEAGKQQQAQPHQRDPRIVDRRAVAKMNHRTDHTRARRNRHPDKILLSRPSWIPRLRIDADVEPRQPARPADQKNKADEDPDMHQLLPQLRMSHLRQHPKPPDVREQTRRNSKRNHVRKRIQLLAKVARRVRHPRNNAVQPIEQNRDAQRQRRPVKVTLVRYRSLDALRNRVVSGCHIARGE